jgi:hypothetical protein
MRYLLANLDAGWAVLRRLLSGPPPFPRRPDATIRGKAALVAAVPDAELTCGYGCAYVGLADVGLAGVEVAGFYSRDYPRLCAQARVGALSCFEHYFFYELVRNFHVFGGRHRAFVTGFAVFMRYVLMDAVGCADNKPEVRAAIEGCEGVFVDGCAGGLGFLEAMTGAGGLPERRDRLAGVCPSDQPCMQGSAQLHLWRIYGGERFLERFFTSLHALLDDVEDVPRANCLAWLAYACVAARLFLMHAFVERWRFAQTPRETEALEAVDWTREDPLDCIRQLLEGSCFRLENL